MSSLGISKPVHVESLQPGSNINKGTNFVVSHLASTSDNKTNYV